MTQNNVHVIYSHIKTPQEIQSLAQQRNLQGFEAFGLYVEDRDALGKAIAELAAKNKETVWFHDYKDPVGGAPVVLLECSDAFLKEVEKIPGFVKAHPLSAWPNLKTERSAKVQSYFSPVTAKPSAPKPPTP